MCAAFASRFSLIRVGIAQMHQIPVKIILRRCTILRTGFSLVPYCSNPEDGRARALYP